MNVLFVFLCLVGAGELASNQADRAPCQLACEEETHMANRKTVTVYADSEAEAFAKANLQHPKWTAIKAKKTGSGKAYQVTMVMKD